MPDSSENLLTRTAIIRNRLGLHARPAAMFVKTANKYQSEIWVECEEEQANGKSIMGLMMLAAPGGAELTVSAEGPDAAEAIEELAKIVESGFGED